MDDTPGPLDSIARRLGAGDAEGALNAAFELLERPGATPALLAEASALGGDAAHRLGLADLAERLWRQSLLVDPAHAPVLARLGQSLAQRGRAGEAEPLLREALRLVPDTDAAAWSNLGVLLAGRDPVEAERCQRRAIEIDPANATAHTNLGVLLAARHLTLEAEQAHRRAIELNPFDAAARTNLGLVLEVLKREEEALASHRAALMLDPASAEIHSNLGNLLGQASHANARDAEAGEAHLREAIRLGPERAAFHSSLGVFLGEHGRDNEAEAAFAHALALDPGYQRARLNLGFLLLAQGRLAAGWPLHEARHHPDLPNNGINPPRHFDIPRWTGEPLAGRSLLVWAEQGLGDQIQFCRYVPLLKRLGAGRVTLVCSRALKRLFDTLAGADRVLPATVIDNEFAVPPGELAGHDAWLFLLSIPWLVGTTLETIPATIPYLRAPPLHPPGLDLPARVAGDARRVGLVWRGNPHHHNDADRSIPSLAMLAPLWSVPGVEFFALQPGAADHEARAAPASQPLRPIGGSIKDFADTAAVLAQLDLLICVDTSIAHLAGALGIRCWMLLPAHRPDWRWLRGRDDSPWYPGVMRLFRQPRRDDWAGLIDQVRAALAGERITPGSSADPMIQ